VDYEKPIVEVGGVTAGGLGHATIYGRIRLFADRLEFDKRTQHVVIPIAQISGVATEGLLSRKIKVYSKAGELVELESPYMTKGHFDQLSEALRRLSSGETLAPGQLQRERDEAVADAAASAAWGVVNAFKLVWSLGERVFSALDERANKRSDDKEP
jgi:hypothetical protein